MITGLVITVVAVFKLDLVLNLFYWFSGLPVVAIVAIVAIEILVCIAIIMYLQRNKGEENLFQTTILSTLATIGLVLGEYLLMSRFGLLAGTVVDGVDPTVTSWGLSIVGGVLVLLPFALLGVGYVLSRVRNSVNEELLRDVLS